MIKLKLFAAFTNSIILKANLVMLAGFSLFVFPSLAFATGGQYNTYYQVVGWANCTDCGPLPTTHFVSKEQACSSLAPMSDRAFQEPESWTFTTYLGVDGPGYNNDYYCRHDLTVVTWVNPTFFGVRHLETSHVGPTQSATVQKYFYCPTALNAIPDTPTTYPRLCHPANAPLNAKDNAGLTCPHSSQPITFTAGNKVLPESDYSSLGSYALDFNRTYNSTSNVSATSSGSQWSNSYSRFIPYNDAEPFAYRPNGKVFSFIRNYYGVRLYESDLDITDRLDLSKDGAGNPTAWHYTVADSDEIELYNIYPNSSNFNVSSIAARSGLTKTMNYSCKTVSTTCPVVTPDIVAPASDLLIMVSDSLGRSLHFSYDTMNRISTMTNPAGGAYTYAYDANNNLSSVTYPDGKTKTYLYGEAGNVSATPNAGVSYTNSLTGIIDENNNRYANYFYDAAGRANAEYLAGNVDTANLIYNTDASGNPTSTNVTDARGSTRTYNFTTILGVVKSTGQSQPGGSGCSASASAITYDANGNVASRNDFDGHRTTYAYDLTRNLETSRTEGLTSAGAVTPATRTITTTWHPTWRLPLVTTEYTGGTTNLADGSGTPTGTALHKTTNVYDSKGNITSITETDPVRSLNRITTITYTYSTAVPGLVLTKVINGPRTDVTDTTTYQYYPHDATCTPSAAAPIVDPITGIAPANLGCRGQVNTITNALGQVTTYNRYNHHGQVEQMTDANGLVTSYTYDLRQRLLSKTVSGAGVPSQSTNLTYDNAGQVTQLKMADNSTLNYTYDAAHRLTDIQDTLGNTIHYTLDASGNRTTEDTKDPLGNLAKTITRSYDALNRLQQVTGVE